MPCLCVDGSFSRSAHPPVASFITSAQIPSIIAIAKSSFLRSRTSLRPEIQTSYFPLAHALPLTAASSLRQSPRRAPAKQPAGGKGPLSSDFLSVSGTLATLVGAIMLLPTAWQGVVISKFLSSPLVRRASMAISSFAYGLFLARFDLAKARTLKLTIVFSILLRLVAVPALSHIVAIAGYLTATVHSAPGLATMAKGNGANVLKGGTLESATLSSLFLLSATPPCFSPSLGQLAPHVHTTLLAILVVLTYVLFPMLPAVSHAISTWAHGSAVLNVAAVLPAVAAPPGPAALAVTTTAPFIAGLVLSRALPSRRAAAAALVALPIAWGASLVLTLGAVAHTVAHAPSTPLPTMLASAALCVGVSAAMLLLARLLAAALLLKRRARRTLMLYLCTPGATIATGVTPPGYAAAPYAVAALLATLCTAVMARKWSHVVIRTSDDVI